MQLCPRCEAANSDSAKFCAECGSSLAAPAAAVSSEAASNRPSSSRRVEADSLNAAAVRQAKKLVGIRRVDVLFVLDCTASMHGELKAMKDTILNFADTIERDGVQTRIGLLAFRDLQMSPPEESQLLLFDGSPFTRDAKVFRREVSQLRAEGGGDLPESSLDAILLALRQPFDDESDKVIILVTDAPPHLPDREARSIEQVSTAIQAAGLHQLYLVIRVQEAENRIYLKLLEGTVGLAFDLGQGDDLGVRAEAFQRTLKSLGRTISKATR